MKTLTFLFLLCLSTALRGDQKPNVLIIIADDCTFSDLPLNGGQNAKTPHLDALANQSLVFDRAYLGMAMCSPCRSELYTGRYPHRNGCAWNHGTCRPGTKSMPHLLNPLGYRVGLSGKIHVKPKSVFPFEKVPGFDPSCVRNPTNPHNLAGSKEFITRDSKQPFCLVVALTEPHAPWVMGDASAYPPKKIKLPSYLADTPMTRKQYADYLAEITYMDSQVGELLALLDETKLADGTLVLFTSEQGAQFPGCKWTNWDNGLHTSLVARWPGKIAPARTKAIVQYADILPTLLDLAGAEVTPEKFDGTSFAAVLYGKHANHRDYAFGMHNNFPEGPSYPIRSVTNGEWRYIRNLSPDTLYIEKHLMGKSEHNPYWQSWVFSSFSNPQHEKLVNRFMNRPPEELYHTTEDHFEMTNLATDPAHAKIKKKLSTILDEQLRDQGDPGGILDTKKAHKAAANLKPDFKSKP
ncbi:sulfatase [bacterium]|nr:sulfatase [Akkermansiaceae bacterium]MDA8964709.1 sulfatase [bacterium]MDB4576511.1 sulfatase [Akkermansiaceae bacterium]MDG2323248.1 sulfatase [Akkermansiaceae bacterium]